MKQVLSLVALAFVLSAGVAHADIVNAPAAKPAAASAKVEKKHKPAKKAKAHKKAKKGSKKHVSVKK